MPRQAFDILAILPSSKDMSVIRVTMSRFAAQDDKYPLAIEHTSQKKGCFHKQRNIMFVTPTELHKLAEQMMMAADDAETILRARMSAESIAKGLGKTVTPTCTGDN